MQYPQQVAESYLSPMRGGPAKSVEARVRDLWWPHFISALNQPNSNLLESMDRLDVYMNEGRSQLQELAGEYAVDRGFARGGAEYTQRLSQFLKSNTGKMFERFIGFSLAEALLRSESRFAAYGFNATGRSMIPGIDEDSFRVDVHQRDSVFSTQIDSDLILFDPTGADEQLIMVSVKSTLKDRFHNVPFWNLLRMSALDEANSSVTPRNAAVLHRIKYIAVCTDLAQEQPDFSASGGPRNLLQIDAALLDGAFVTGSRVVGVNREYHGPVFGSSRQSPFLMLSSLISALSG